MASSSALGVDMRAARRHRLMQPARVRPARRCAVTMGRSKSRPRRSLATPSPIASSGRNGSGARRHRPAPSGSNSPASVNQPNMRGRCIPGDRPTWAEGNATVGAGAHQAPVRRIERRAQRLVARMQVVVHPGPSMRIEIGRRSTIAAALLGSGGRPDLGGRPVSIVVDDRPHPACQPTLQRPLRAEHEHRGGGQREQQEQRDRRHFSECRQPVRLFQRP